MMTTVNSSATAVTPPLSQHSSSAIHTGGHYQQQRTTTTATKKAVAHLQSLSDFRPIRTDSDEAVVGENNGKVSSKAPLRLSSSYGNSAKDVVNRPRSLSAGRPRTSSAVDLVQEIYNRLGISRGESVPSKRDPNQESVLSRNFLDYSKNIAMSSSATGSDSNQPTRGRSMVQKSDETDDGQQQRARSLSRGRQLRSIWPPVSESSSNTTTQAPFQTSRDSLFTPTATSSTTSTVRSPEEVAAVMLSSPKSFIRNSKLLQNHSQQQLVNDSLTSSTKTTPIRTTATLKNNVFNSDDKKATDDMNDAAQKNDTYLSGLPVKERMRAFSEPTKKASDIKRGKSTKNAPTERNYPPLIDIFAEERARYQSISKTNSIDGDTEEEKKDDAPFDSTSNGVRDLLRRQTVNTNIGSSHDIATPPSSRGKGALLASAFLTAIHSSPNDNSGVLSPRTSTSAPTFTFAPINEIATDDHGSVLDNGSVSILSSVGSQDETNLTISPLNRFNNYTNGSTTHIRKPSWIDNRNKQRSSLSDTNAANNKGGNTTFVASGRQPHAPPSTVTQTEQQQLSKQQSNSSMIERMIEERVQARVAELERRMEQQMRTYMEQLETKMATRIANQEKEK